jgi:tryptophan synthase alpha chain
MNALAELLSSHRTHRKKALALFLTAGYPLPDSTPGLVLPLVRAGADIIEIGIPFSDPLADGPVIQKSSAAAIANGVTIRSILQDVRTIRKSTPVPLVLMGYVNPILSYGAGRFFRDAADSGVNGVILPELTLEESGRFRNELASCGLSQILLVAPTTPSDRVRAIDEASTGFLYCVSTTGVTGSAGKGTPDEFLARVRVHATRNPLLIGFGISSAEDARHAASLGDGVIIGSALIRRIEGGGDADSLSAWVRSIRGALEIR